jgi:hypothetical protein
MTTFRLNRFVSQPEVLRGIAPEILLALLADHAAALEAQGLTLPDEADAASIDYERMKDLLMEPDRLPPRLREAFYFIHEMATREGMACLLEAAAQAEPPIEIVSKPSETTIGTLGLIVGEPGPTPGDVAVQVWLKDHELVERIHAEQFLQNARSFRSFGTAVTPVPPHRNPIAVVPQIKNDLDDYFEMKKRGRHTKVFPYVRDGCVMFLLRHGDPFKRGSAIDERGESVGVYYWPEKFDVLALDPVGGELRINTRNKGEWSEYRKVFGRHLYGDDKFFSVGETYTLEPLQTIGEDAIAPIDGIERVVLTEVRFDWGGKYNEKEIREADDVFALYRAPNRKFPTTPRIVKACFRITFSDSAKPRTVTITPPNEAQYMRDDDSAVVEQWLKSRGFIAKPGQAQTGYTYDEPANYTPIFDVEKILVRVGA